MEQRRNAIVQLVNREGSLSFAQLKQAFPSVSEMTLRTDLKALDQARRVVRVHGGVKSVEVVVGTDDQLSLRTARNARPSRSSPKRRRRWCARTPRCFWIPAAPRRRQRAVCRMNPC